MPEVRTIRQAQSQADVDRINEFFNKNQIKADLHWFTHSDTLERAFRRSDRRLFYMGVNQTIVGAAMVWCESRVLDNEEAQIRQVAVGPDVRGEGVGRQLCRASEEFASEFGQRQMIADVDKESPAVAFWEATGYEPVDEWQTDSGRTMLRVKKQLD